MILYEDAALVVLDKPAGLSSEEGVPAALRAHWNAPDAFVGVVHRLDTGVSGLMVYARTPAAAAALSRQVTQSQDAYAVQDGRAEGKAAAPQFVKQYRAVIAGAPDAQLQAYKKIIDLADVVLCVYDTDIPATSSTEDRALAYAEGQHKSLVLLHPTELTTKQISAAHDAR